jgi:Protein of unknown function (DUF2800)
MTAQHSTLVGGSTAERLLNCPGSYRAIISLPPQPDIQSEAAAMGTHCHHIMDALMQARQSDNNTDLKAEARIWLGDTFHDRELTEETLETLIDPAIDALRQLEKEYGGGFRVAEIELTVRFPEIMDAFGTADLLLTSLDYVMLVDWKFGAVGVRAYYVNDDDSTTMNPQLMFYLCAAQHAKPKLFKQRRIVASIIQPQNEPQLSDTEVFPEELAQFKEDIYAAVAKALGRDAPLHRGEWCRWCPAKPSCPEWLKPLIEYAALNRELPKQPPKVSKLATPYGEQLARAKELSEMISEFSKEVDRQMEIYLAGGGMVPGWTLEPKQKQRKWVDPAVVVPELIKLGFKDDEIWQHNLQTFQITDAAAKKRGKTIPAHLRVAPPSDEMKIVRSTEHKTIVDNSTLIEQLKASVALIDQDAKGQNANDK